MLHDLTHDRLRSLLDYDPETGLFTWRVNRRGKTRIGDIAGGPHPDYGYITIGIDGRRYRANRLAVFWMTGVLPTHEVDHEDRDRTNNRWKNLRDATRSQNASNIGIRSDNTSGAKGVTFNKRKGKWQAQIVAEGRYKYLGLFDSMEDACEAYRVASIELHGEFSNPAKRMTFAQAA